ncbi:hypothetical protein L1987_73097 [Smallanthus sonchifolius]|uniref:Uncharacterized protein n=1 Tax=Smallanthus sonchifolius TaxID=185202 RepID=A0ACB9A0P4_9ASTR|nr:hypothetical protein L1987_73097 [Smallanthus sonchifolius]
MSGSGATITEVKSYIWLKTSDGSIEQVERNVALFCPLIRHIEHSGMGSSKVCPILLPKTIDLSILGVIIDFCQFYHQPGHSDLERKLFNEKFIRTNKQRLRELNVAADSLQLTPLVELTDTALLRFIKGSTTEEIRQAFELPDDLTEEDQWKPITVATDDPQVRLLNKLGERKQQELGRKDKLKNVEVEALHVDNRSIDELMSFINGENEGLLLNFMLLSVWDTNV